MTCKDCGATVTASDRFCPACGTPNASCKFHPKFGPALEIVEPRIISEPAPTGAPSCPRCHRVIDRPEEYCRGCGMHLDTAWQRYDRVRGLDRWHQQGHGDLVPYRSPARLAATLNGVLTVGVGVAATMAAFHLWLYARSEGLLRDGPGSSDVLQWLDVATRAAAILFVVGVAVLLLWMRRAYRNLPALAVADLRYRRGWALWGWLVPGVNLVRPKQVMDDLWRASHPMAPPFSSSWRVGPVPEWSAVWWATLLLGGTLGVASHLLASGPAPLNPADLKASLSLAGTTGVLLASSALALRLLVTRITERQDARAGFVIVDDVEPETELSATGTDANEPVGTVLVHPTGRARTWGKY